MIYWQITIWYYVNKTGIKMYLNIAKNFYLNITNTKY